MTSREEQFLEDKDVQRNWISKLVLVVVLLSFVNVFSFGVQLYVVFKEPEAKYLALDSSLRVRQLTLEDAPEFNEREIITWLVTCVMDATSFSHDKYQREAARASQCFTSQAWEEWFQELSSAGFNEVTEKQTNVKGAPSGVLAMWPAICWTVFTPKSMNFPLYGHGRVLEAKQINSILLVQSLNPLTDNRRLAGTLLSTLAWRQACDCESLNVRCHFFSCGYLFPNYCSGQRAS